MSADPGDFSGDLRLEVPRRSSPRRGEPAHEVLPGGLRATRWTLARAGAENEKEWALEEDPPPQIVTLIALWEYCRMLMLTPVFAVLMIHPHAEWTAWYFWRIYFVASNGGLHVSWMTIVSFLYTLIIGTLIWNTVKWSRWVLVGTSLYSGLLLARFLFFFSERAGSLGAITHAGLNFLQGSAYALIAMNLIIAIGLAFAPGVAEAFRRQK